MSNCANCEKNDGMCYISIPPKYKCTIDNSFHNGMDRCNLYDRGYQQGRTDAEPKWIPVEERLPDKGEVLVCTGKGNIYTSIVGGCFWVSHLAYRFGADKITHWMPLPKPPQKQ